MKEKQERRAMIIGYLRIDEHTMSLVRAFAQQIGCADEVALKFLLKLGKYPQESNEDNEAYAARLEQLPDPDVVVDQGIPAANNL